MLTSTHFKKIEDILNCFNKITKFQSLAKVILEKILPTSYYDKQIRNKEFLMEQIKWKSSMIGGGFCQQDQNTSDNLITEIDQLKHQQSNLNINEE